MKHRAANHPPFTFADRLRAWGRGIGSFLWKRGDQQFIDGVLVNGTAQTVGKLAGVMRQLQTICL